MTSYRRILPCLREFVAHLNAIQCSAVPHGYTEARRATRNVRLASHRLDEQHQPQDGDGDVGRQDRGAGVVLGEPLAEEQAE